MTMISGQESEAKAALRYIPKLLRLIVQTHRGYTIAMIALRLVRSLVPVALLWVGKLILDAVIAVTHGAPRDALWRFVAIEFGIVLLGEILARASALVESSLADLFTTRVDVLLMEHAAALDLAHLENPEFYNRLERARQQPSTRIVVLVQLLGMIQDLVTLGSLAAALLLYSPWLLLLLVSAVLPSFFGETRLAALSYSLLFHHTPERRELEYLSYLGASSATAKEIQVFGLSHWLISRFTRIARRYYSRQRRLAMRKAVVGSSLSFLSSAGYYAAYSFILLRAASGNLTIGALAFLAGAFMRSRELSQRLLLSATDIYAQSLTLRDLFTFLEARPTIASRHDALPVPRPVRLGFEFRDVGFRYPGSDTWAVRHLDFSIPAGSRIALVGENGAGKSTIVKLIARLYDPTEGAILLDGRDLRTYDLASLRSLIGILFQDFIRYELRVDENIGAGGISAVAEYLESLDSAEATERPALADVRNTHERIADASDRAMAAPVLSHLPGGYRQMLGRYFDGGLDLSGGEWQKIALARAYMRDAGLLILDEPTAALDARSEADVFARLAHGTRGRMALIISHRFSTVRIADHIIVIQQGAILEQGTHEELVARPGTYAELFALQAAGYQ